MAPVREIRSSLIARLFVCVLVSLSAPSGQAGVHRSDAPSKVFPAGVARYIMQQPDAPFLVNVACASWAGIERSVRRAPSVADTQAQVTVAPLILFPSSGTSSASLADRLRLDRAVGKLTSTDTTVVIELAGIQSRRALQAWVENLPVDYAEPDCDGPNFATTSAESALNGRLLPAQCWTESARHAFPNDPCMRDLWGHQAIGWTAEIASRSKPRLVAVIDSGIDASHEDLAGAIRPSMRLRQPSNLHDEITDASCRAPGGCYPHGTQMAGTIAGRMNNGVGLAGVAPNSELVPIRIARAEHGNLMRLSSIAAAIDVAADSGADVINISAKWPVDSRAVREAITRATGPSPTPKRLLVTGYTMGFGWNGELIESYPSRYRSMPGVIAAAPSGPLETPFAPGARRAEIAEDSPLMAPGVDIVVTTTQNADGRYALSQAAGASSAAAYTSGAVALVWGTAPLNKCGAREIKQLLYCRSKSTAQSRYPWINVEFLHEMASLPASASCADALVAAGCAD